MLTKTKDGKATSIQLKFEPKNKGVHEQTIPMNPRKNECAVCGSIQNLQRHHVIPYCYRRYMTNKKHTSYDVLPICQECHQAYEEFATDLKIKLGRKYNDPIYESTERYIKEKKGYKIARSLRNHGKNIPNYRKKEMLFELFNIFPNVKDPIQEALKFEMKVQPHGQKVMNGIESEQEFAEMWREHFISMMNPQRLPKDWDPHEILYD